MPEYTLLAVLSVVAVVAVETLRWRTGIFRTAQFWVSMAIVAAFQVLVDGWLTKLSAPVVRYAPRQFLGLRAPWDIPVEDFLFGFSMVTLAILLWVRAGRTGPGDARGTSAGHVARTSTGILPGTSAGTAAAAPTSAETRTPTSRPDTRREHR